MKLALVVPASEGIRSLAIATWRPVSLQKQNADPIGLIATNSNAKGL